MVTFTITCPRCQGSGRTAGYRGAEGKCYRCSGSGRLPEPSLTTSSIRRWIKVAHVLALQPGSQGRDVDDALENAYGRASVSGVLGAMREQNLTTKDAASPARWSLTPDGFLWQQLYCRECLSREPAHKKKCTRPAPITVAGILPGQSSATPALESLLDTALGELTGLGEIVVALGNETATIRVADVSVELELADTTRQLDAVTAVALGEALARAGRQAQGEE